MKYIVIFQTEYDGDKWRLWNNGVFDDSEDALREIRKQAPEHPNGHFEMHFVNDHLWRAMCREAEIWQYALRALQGEQ